MTDFEDYEDDDEPQYQDGNKLVQDLRRQLKAKTKAEKELQDKVKALETTTRKSQITQVLKEAGVPEKVASLVPGDVEPTPEGVKEWLKEYGEVFGATQTATSSPEGQGDQEVPEDVQKMQQMQNVASAGEFKGQTRQVKPEDLMAASSMEELMALIAKGASSS